MPDKSSLGLPAQYRNRRRMTLLCALSALAFGAPAEAEIYKCRLPNGKTEIANSPCPSGAGTVSVRPDEPVSESARQQAERDVTRMRDYVERREAAERADAQASLRAEREAAAASRPANSKSAARRYGDPEACLRDVEQQALEASQRAALEADCRSLVRPTNSTTVVPMYIPVPRPTHRPLPPPQPETPARPPAPGIAICPPGKPCR